MRSRANAPLHVPRVILPAHVPRQDSAMKAPSFPTGTALFHALAVAFFGGCASWAWDWPSSRRHSRCWPCAPSWPS
jgi:hypothetical protein